MTNLFELGELCYDNLILRPHHLGPLIRDGRFLESKLLILFQKAGEKYVYSYTVGSR